MQTEPRRTVLAERYALQTELGRNGVGTLWTAIDRILDRRVVVKLIDPRLAADAAFRERLFDDARSLAACPGRTLVRLLDAGADDGVPFLVTEWVDGEGLDRTLERTGSLEPARAARLAADALDGVAEAHDAGVLDLALTPANVLLHEDAVRVRDPGIVPAVLASKNAAGVLTHERLPPEASRRDPVDERSDVWCGGALLFELLTGRPPRSDETSARRIRRTVPRAIDIVAARALSADPAARFRTVREMASALRHSVAGLGSPGSERPNRGERRSIRSVFSMWVAVPLVVAIVAAGVVGAGLWLGRLELGGSVGIEIRRGGASTSPPALARPLPVVAITAFDPPPGDGHENDANLPLAIDDHPATVWKSEDYYDGRLNKPGVGVLLDLGAERTVSGFRLDSPSPGFRFAVVVGDDPAAMAATAQPTYRAPDVERDLPPATGRYVLVWITSVVPTPDGSRAEISDVRVYGSS